MGDFIRSITPLQWFGVVILFNSVLIGGTTQLAHLFIPEAGVQAIGAFCTLVNAFLGGLVTMFGRPMSMAMSADQATMVKAVAAMPGMDPLHVNARANSTLAALAVDPANAKIGPSPGATAAVQAIAQS